MNEPTATLEREDQLQGMGCERKLEDARFTHGKGTYVDDIKLPGMLFGDSIARSPAHARIVRSTRRRRKPCRESLRC